MKRDDFRKRIEDAPELKSIFDRFFKEWLSSSGYVNQEECEHFFIAGRESVAEELETWRSPKPKPRRIELHLTIKNESDSSNPVTLEQVYTL